jgi:hypothetical protein
VAHRPIRTAHASGETKYQKHPGYDEYISLSETKKVYAVNAVISLPPFSLLEKNVRCVKSWYRDSSKSPKPAEATVYGMGHALAEEKTHLLLPK